MFYFPYLFSRVCFFGKKWERAITVELPTRVLKVKKKEDYASRTQVSKWTRRSLAPPVLSSPVENSGWKGEAGYDVPVLGTEGLEGKKVLRKGPSTKTDQNRRFPYLLQNALHKYI